MKTYYIINYQYSNAIKNKLHDSFEQFVIKQNRIATESLRDLKKSIRIEVNALNETYSRCNPIELWFTDFSKRNTKTFAIHTNTPIQAQILEVKIPFK